MNSSQNMIDKQEYTSVEIQNESFKTLGTPLKAQHQKSYRDDAVRAQSSKKKHDSKELTIHHATSPFNKHGNLYELSYLTKFYRYSEEKNNEVGDLHMRDVSTPSKEQISYLNYSERFSPSPDQNILDMPA